MLIDKRIAHWYLVVERLHELFLPSQGFQISYSSVKKPPQTSTWSDQPNPHIQVNRIKSRMIAEIQDDLKTREHVHFGQNESNFPATCTL